MTHLPDCFKRYIYQWFTRYYKTAFVIVDESGVLTSWGGAIDELGFEHLTYGCKANEQFCFLTGMLPLKEPSFYIPLFKTQTQHLVDIHIFEVEKGYGILIVDQTDHAARLIELQQKANELALRLERSGP